MEPDKRFEFWRKAEEEATEPKNKEEIREAWMLDCHSSFIAEMFANEIDAAEGENREPVASNEDNACDQGEANNDEDSSDPSCYVFHCEDSFPVGTLIKAIRDLMDRPKLRRS